MKKFFILLGIFILGVLLIFTVSFSLYYFCFSTPIVGEFELSEMTHELEKYPSTKNVGEILDAETAIEKAKQLWIEDLSVWYGQEMNPINGRKIDVAYDAESDCWRVSGTLGPDTIGIVPMALIKSNGDVLSVCYW